MNPLVDRIAEVTGLRDLERLDQALTQLIQDTLEPLEVAVWVSVNDAGRRHWLLRSRQRQGVVGNECDPAHSLPASLPRFESLPQLAECATTQLWQQQQEGSAWTSCFPLFSDPDSQGVLQLCSSRPLGAQRQRMIFGLLRFYANFRDLVTENERDMLTGLLNRKTFDESFARLAMASGGDPAASEDRRASSAAAPCWLAVADIDHFKRVNDGFGHLIGDEVLLLTARLMRSSFRFSDRVFRFGGEEFVLLLRHADQEGALGALEKFRHRVASQGFPQVGNITISLGLTAIGSDDTPDRAFARADKAVYAAKQDGRNRVLLYEDLVAAGRLEPQPAVGPVDFF